MSLQRISLAMIVRNEEERLAECLESVKDTVDEMVIVDTGSCDDTVRIAKQYTEKVYCFPWSDDFSAARNFAIEQTIHEWILYLDADERLDIQAGDLYALVNQGRYSAYCLPLYAIKEAGDYRESDRFMVLRLFKRKYRFKGAIHEYVFVNDPEEVGTALFPVICHTAVSSAERHIRRGRNIALLKKAIAENTTDPYLQYYLGIEWLGLGRFNFAISAFRKALNKLSPQQIVFRSPAVRHLIQCYKNAGQLDEAICLCLEESQHYPEYGDLYFDGGVLFELKSEYSIAIKWFQEAVKLGTPPIAFFHTDGTGGYLANYHLGYCSEKIGLYKEAIKHYEEALNNNKNYYYPLYPLVLLQVAQHSAKDAIKYLDERGYLAIPEVAEKMAELFWSIGLPDIGLRCLANTMPLHDAGWELLIQCQLYSGDIAGAFQSIRQMRQNDIAPGAVILVDEIAALLMQDRCEEARGQLWELWRRPESRDTFRAMFCLYKKLCHKIVLPLSNHKAATALLDLERRCLRTQTSKIPEQECFAALIRAIRAILADDTETLALLISELSEKEQDIKRNLDYTFTVLRGLYR